MEPNVHLIVHNVISIISSIAALGMGYFTFLNGPRKVTNVTWTLMLISVAMFTISHVIGVNISDPILSKNVLMLNLSVFFISAFSLHAALALIGKTREHRILIAFTYALAAGLVIFFLAYPDTFLLPSVPKMYFPNYYNPGILNWTRVAFMYVFVVPYIIFQLVQARRRTEEKLRKIQYKYLILSYVLGYAFGFIPNFLVYNIPIDPAIGMACIAFLAIPFVYGAVKYGLLNVRVIAVQAFWYSMAVAIIGGLITLFNYINSIIIESNSNFPIWTISMGSSVLVVSISVLIWRKLRESDLLKYEFITTVTHKFRTPLTHIKWASENLSGSALPETDKMQLGYIVEANSKLVELTNLLMNVSEAENSAFEYKRSREDVSEIVNETIDSLMPQLNEKKIQVDKNVPSGMFAEFDPSRIRFVFQTFFENAVRYTPNNTSIKVTVERKRSDIVVSVKDNGIGIPKDELPLLFSKFYRGKQARLTDTEGMGIGLFMAKNVIENHKGRIWAESDGSGTGSTFSFSLPASDPKN